MLFQQDGTPSNFHIVVLEFVIRKLPWKWSGRRWYITWPPRSLDFTILNFFVWGWRRETHKGYLSHFAIAHNFHGTLWEDAGCCDYIYTVVLTNIWTKFNTDMECAEILAVPVLNVSNFCKVRSQVRDHITLQIGARCFFMIHVPLTF
jgi:hypothetical protein